MKQITVERQKGFFGALRGLDIYVDGTRLGKIKQGEMTTFEVPEIGREIWGKMDWGETPRLSLKTYTEDKTVVFKAYFTFNPFKQLGLSKIPFNLFLR